MPVSRGNGKIDKKILKVSSLSVNKTDSGLRNYFIGKSIMTSASTTKKLKSILISVSYTTTVFYLDYNKITYRQVFTDLFQNNFT